VYLLGGGGEIKKYSHIVDKIGDVGQGSPQLVLVSPEEKKEKTKRARFWPMIVIGR